MSRAIHSDDFGVALYQAIPGPCTVMGVSGYYRGDHIAYAQIHDGPGAEDAVPLMTLALAPQDNFSFPIPQGGIEVGQLSIVLSTNADTFANNEGSDMFVTAVIK